jgi:hypothetical protein
VSPATNCSGVATVVSWKCRVAILLRSQPRRDGDPADVLVGMLARAVEDARPHPQDPPPEVVRVALDLRGEEFDGAGLGPQELFRVVEVLPGLRDRSLGVVVELLVLVTADDVSGFEGLDLVDRLPPRSDPPTIAACTTYMCTPL